MKYKPLQKKKKNKKKKVPLRDRSYLDMPVETQEINQLFGSYKKVLACYSVNPYFRLG